MFTGNIFKEEERTLLVASFWGPRLQVNIVPMITWIQSQFEKWSSLYLSWIGHISVVKMKILSKIFFNFQNVLIF